MLPLESCPNFVCPHSERNKACHSILYIGYLWEEQCVGGHAWDPFNMFRQNIYIFTFIRRYSYILTHIHLYSAQYRDSVMHSQSP